MKNLILNSNSQKDDKSGMELMREPIVFMFPGQGSQFYNMGKELYQDHPRFKFWMDYCDEITKPLLQTSLIKVIYENHQGKTQPFDQIHFTNPALVSIAFSLAQIVMESDIQPDYVLGYSLGEITAALISGVLTLEEALKITIDFADFVHSGTERAGMLGIVDSVDLLEKYPEMFRSCWLTGKNFNQNFVVSGRVEDIHILEKNLLEKNIIFQKLPVNYGFHTPLMDPIEQHFKDCVSGLKLALPKIPIISSLRAAALDAADTTYFWEVVRKPVWFEDAINSMLIKGDCIFIDVGPSGTLSTAVKYILRPNSKSKHFEVINQFGHDLKSYEKLKSGLVHPF